MADTFNASTPLDFIDSFFDNLRESKISYDEALQKLSDRFNADILASDQFQLPSLNVKKLDNLKPFSLVRFRCMIQDMKDPEIVPVFIKSASTTKCCLFRCYAEWPDDFDFDANQSLISRHVFKCIPIPSETGWVKQMWHELEENCGILNDQRNANSIEFQHTSKRNLEDNSEMEADTVENGAHPQKRPHIQKEVVVQEKQESVQAQSCIVKVYTNGETYKLNDCVEFTGVWNCNEVDSSKRYSLHAVCAKVLPHIHPKLSITTQESHKNDYQIAYDEAIRSKFIDYFQKMLLGDRLAAEYLTCHLISTVIHKSVMCIGKFTLNLHNIPEPDLAHFVNNLKDALCRVVSKVHYLPLSLDLLNNERFVPYKNYETNSLCTGRLQLSAGTLLIIDETKLEVGQLNEQGVRNIAALKTLILHQKVDYDFSYHGIEFRTDISVLILSEGPTCLSSDYALPICKFSNMTETQDIDSYSLNDFRSYLIRMRKCDWEINEKMRDKIPDDFVEMRRQNTDVDQTKLHELLVLSRWLTCSYGSTMLTENFWDLAKSMERERNNRKKK